VGQWGLTAPALETMCMSEQAGREERGSLEVITGCMFSGKSERLVRRLAEARAEGLTAVAFKHSSDNRYGRQSINTHNGGQCEAIGVSDARQIPDLAGSAGFIAIDEAQFFGRELVEVCQQLMSAGKDLVVAGLDLDSWGRPFGPMPELAEMADRATWLYAVCARCGQTADHTQRVAPIDPGGTMIGGAEAYEPRCAACFEAPPIELRR